MTRLLVAIALVATGYAIAHAVDPSAAHAASLTRSLKVFIIGSQQAPSMASQQGSQRP